MLGRLATCGQLQLLEPAGCPVGPGAAPGASILFLEAWGHLLGPQVIRVPSPHPVLVGCVLEEDPYLPVVEITVFLLGGVFGVSGVFVSGPTDFPGWFLWRIPGRTPGGLG